VVKWLVEQGHANVNQANNNGGSPLFMSACYGHFDVVKFD